MNHWHLPWSRGTYWLYCPCNPGRGGRKSREGWFSPLSAVSCAGFLPQSGGPCRTTDRSQRGGAPLSALPTPPGVTVWPPGKGAQRRAAGWFALWLERGQDRDALYPKMWVEQRGDRNVLKCNVSMSTSSSSSESKWDVSVPMKGTEARNLPLYMRDSVPYRSVLCWKVLRSSVSLKYCNTSQYMDRHTNYHYF